MLDDTFKLTDEKVLIRAREVLEEPLPLEAEGYTCTTEDLLNVLLGVAANRGPLSRFAPTWWARRMPKRSAPTSTSNCAWKTCPSLKRA